MATIKNLAHGQLPNSKGTLYTASGAAVIKSIILVNTNTTTEVVNLYHYAATASTRLIPKDTSLAAGYSLVFDTMVTMANGELIQGDTTTASKVDYTISGVDGA